MNYSNYNPLSPQTSTHNWAVPPNAASNSYSQATTSGTISSASSPNGLSGILNSMGSHHSLQQYFTNNQQRGNSRPRDDSSPSGLTPPPSNEGQSYEEWAALTDAEVARKSGSSTTTLGAGGGGIGQSFLPPLPGMSLDEIEGSEASSIRSGRRRKRRTTVGSSGMGGGGGDSFDEGSGFDSTEEFGTRGMRGISGSNSVDYTKSETGGEREGSSVGALGLDLLPPPPPKPTKKAKASTAAKGKGKAKAKKNENAGGNGGFEEEESEVESKKAKGPKRKMSGDKKKKAGRACAACQKAHLTCDDARPCARCVKKGCPDECHDGARKKAKYLQEVPDELLERRMPIRASPAIDQGGDSGDSPTDLDMLNNVMHHQNDPTRQPFSLDSLPYYDTQSFSSHEFGSEAANLEYAILSSMLNGNGFAVEPYGSMSNMGTGGEVNGQDSRLNGSANPSTMLGLESPMPKPLPLEGMGAIASGSTPGNYSGLLANAGSYSSLFDRGTGSSATSPAGGMHFGGGMSPRLMESAMSSLGDLMKPAGSSISNGVGGVGSSSLLNSTANETISNTGAGITAGNSSAFLLDQSTIPPPNLTIPPSGGKKEYPGRTAQSTKTLTAEEAYRTVTKPYAYAQSYHYLVRHLKERFEKNDILRIIRALATFRPSLIALQMPLTEEDETFVERTFQRTLVELNKLISFSGTPTVVWRRTGEICLVGTEFCLLTGWTREELLGKKYIFELFDTASVVEYYESFAKHAFESTSPSVMTQCVVVGPNGRPVPCAFCFSVRRDLFSLPFIVIGSFLPVLI